ncbi:MAG: hypothetical protein ABSE63_12025, partial [Thermoguttaceae bacterium]
AAMSYPAQNPMAAPGPIASSRMSPSAGFPVPGRVEDGARAPAQTDAPPLPPVSSSPQRLPPVSLRQPAGSMETYQGIPNITAPLPPGIR